MEQSTASGTMWISEVQYDSFDELYLSNLNRLVRI